MSQLNNLPNRKIYLACDHAGFEHKNAIFAWLESEGFLVIDEGAYAFDPLDDFPDFIKKAALQVSNNSENSVAIIFGGSGQGEAMVANRFPQVRATVYYGGAEEIIKLSREHNDANVLSIGARFVSIDETKKVIWQWLQGLPNTDKKYVRRNQKLENLLLD